MNLQPDDTCRMQTHSPMTMIMMTTDNKCHYYYYYYYYYYTSMYNAHTFSNDAELEALEVTRCSKV